MKTLLKKLIIIILLFLGFYTSYASTGQVDDSIQKIAIIIDSSEFYDASFIDDFLHGFELINQTHENIDYDVYTLYNYTTINIFPYKVNYYYNNSVTNHTVLTEELINTDLYDLIILVGYELRRGFLDVTEYPDTKFMFYDLSGQSTGYSGTNFPQNLMILSFREKEVGFIAGTLATSVFENSIDKVAIIGTYNGDPRSKQLIAGFQSAILRNHTDAKIFISYIEDFIDSEKAESIATELSTSGFDLIFSALQNNNSLGVQKGVLGPHLISVDTNRSFSITKNNTKTLLYTFNEIITKGWDNYRTISGGEIVFGLEDDVFIPTDWGNDNLVNSTMSQIYEDVIISSLQIPDDINYASNTYGFEGYIIIVIFIFTYIKQHIFKKKR